MVVLQGRNEYSTLHLCVNPLHQERRKLLQLLCEGSFCPCHETRRLGIKQVDVLVVWQHYLRTVMGRQSPPRLLQCTHQPIYDVAHEASLAFSHLCHDQSGKLPALGKRGSLITGAVAIGLEL